MYLLIHVYGTEHVEGNGSGNRVKSALYQSIAEHGSSSKVPVQGPRVTDSRSRIYRVGRGNEASVPEHQIAKLSTEKKGDQEI